jgi:hypothetical protein
VDSFAGIYEAIKVFGRVMNAAINEAFDEDSPPAAPVSTKQDKNEICQKNW